MKRLSRPITLLLFLVCACHPPVPVLNFHASFPPLSSTNNFSLLDTLAVGASFELAGIYDFLAMGNREVPVIRLRNERGTCYAMLDKPADAPYGTLVKITGYIVIDSLRIKPQSVTVKKIQAGIEQVLNRNEEYRQKSDRLYNKYLSQFVQFNVDKQINLTFPEQPEWRYLYDEKKQTISAYTFITNNIYESRLEIFFNLKNKQAECVTLYSYFKGE